MVESGRDHERRRAGPVTRFFVLAIDRHSAGRYVVPGPIRPSVVAYRPPTEPGRPARARSSARPGCPYGNKTGVTRSIEILGGSEALAAIDMTKDEPDDLDGE